MKFYFLLTGIIALMLVLAGVVMAVPPPVTAPTSATVTVNEWVSITLTKVPVQFSSMDPGTTANASADYGYPAIATLGSETNVNIKIGTKANAANFVHSTNASLTFPVSNMKWSPDGSTGWTNYTTSDATVCTGLGASGTCNIYHQLTIPSAQAAGAYSVGITVTASKV